MAQYKRIINSFFLIATVMMVVSCKEQEKQDIILPDGYRGWFAIVFDCSCGLGKEMAAGRIQQVIPNNGILLVNYPRNRGDLDMRFYYQTKEGKKLIGTVDNGYTPSSDSLSLGGHLTRFSFNGKSKCSSNDEDFYEHEIVFHCVDEGDIFLDKELSAFEEKLEKYLRKK